MIINQMKELIAKRIVLDPNDHVAIQDIWDKEIEVLTFSLDETISFIKSASKDLLYWSSEVWEDISSKFKSIELVKAMKLSALKYNDIKNDLLDSALDAEKMINDK